MILSLKFIIHQKTSLWGNMSKKDANLLVFDGFSGFCENYDLMESCRDHTNAAHGIKSPVGGMTIFLFLTCK